MVARPTEWLVWPSCPRRPGWWLILVPDAACGDTCGLRTRRRCGALPITESSLGDGILRRGRLDRRGRGLRQSESDQEFRSRSRKDAHASKLAALCRDHSRRGPWPTADARPVAYWRKGVARAVPRRPAPQCRCAGSCRLADLMALDTRCRSRRRKGRHAAGAWIFAARRPRDRRVWAAGRHRVREGRHVDRDAFHRRISATARRLQAF